MSLAIQAESGRSLVSTRKLAPFALLFSMGIIDIAWAAISQLDFTGFDAILCGVIALLGVSIVYSEVRRDQRLSEMAYFAAVWILFTAVCAPFTYLVATLNLPLYDDSFDVIDKLLGFNWLAYHELTQENRTVHAILGAAYDSFFPQILFSIIFFSHIQKAERNEALFLSAFIALVITALVSGFLPAAGANHHYGTGLNHAVHLHDFFALRNGSVTQFALHRMEGIIAFPSYHTIIAILIIHAYRGTVLFVPVLVLNVLMLLSTPVFGGHYLADMLGGGAIAVFSIHFANRARALINDDDASAPVDFQCSEEPG